MPVSLTISIAPVVLFSMMPPVGPGRSDMVSRSKGLGVMAGMGGLASRGRAGTSAALPQKQPTQMG